MGVQLICRHTILFLHPFWEAIMISEQQIRHQCRCNFCRHLNEHHVATQFGAHLKHARLEAGYLSPETLSAAISKHCGVYHSARSIYRYESAATAPSLSFLIAASIVLDLSLFSDLLTEVLSENFIERLDATGTTALCDCSSQMKLF